MRREFIVQLSSVCPIARFVLILIIVNYARMAITWILLIIAAVQSSVAPTAQYVLI